jgi:predicted DNA-binding WGR domain protein
VSAREFEFREGSSDKFWRISLDGKSTTVVFGRRGTNGQTQIKKWGSPDEARKNHDKLIAEKTKKGYVEKKVAHQVEAAAPAPAPAPAVPAVSLSVEPHLDLSPGDWAIATWRKQAAAKPASPAPFDREACDAKLRGVPSHGGDRDHLNWAGVAFAEVMSREEAHYWFLAMTPRTPKDRAARLANAKLDGRVTLKEVRAAFKAASSHISISEYVEIAQVLSNLLSPGELAELLLEGHLKAGKGHYVGADFLDGFRRWVVPRLPKADADKLRAQLRPHVTPAKWPSAAYNAAPWFVVAAALGMHNELRAVVESLPDDRFKDNDYDQQPQMVIFGLGDPALVDKHMRRLRLRLKTARQLSGWLAHTELRALEFVTDSILAARDKEECEELIAAFQAVKAPEAAGPMLRLGLQSKAPKGARAWLETNVGHAITGLTAVGAGRGALADAALEQLRDFKRSGFGSQIADAVKALPADQRKRVQVEVVDRQDLVLQPIAAKTTPAWLAKGVAAATAAKKADKKAPMPSWVTPEHLPPFAVDGRRLSDEQVAAVVAALQASTLDKPHPLITDLRKHADPASADLFVWKLCERWLGEGGSGKEKWALAAVGLLGGDASVLKLTPLVRLWPGESQHPRAVLGLEVLRAIGSDTALMQLNGIAQKLKFQGLKTKAREFMEAIAKEKGLTRAELEDRVVPDFDLDEHGHRAFDYGGRRFNFVLGPECKPMLRDDDPKGKLRDDLPEPGTKDDAEKAAAAIAEWKAIKKQIKDVAKLQADRLEQAMVTGRRWTKADFQTLVVRHPLMTNLARLLLWGVYDGKKLRETFRVTEDQECVNVDDEPFNLNTDRALGLVHPLQLDDGARQAWGQRFSDYAIIPPFPQLGRAIHRLEKGEANQRSIEREVKLPAPTLVFGLEKLGWVRGKGMDNGAFDEHSRQFPDAAVTAVVNYDGNVSYGFIHPDAELTVTGCCFVNGLRAPNGFGHGLEKKLKLGDVDPIVISETLHDLTMLASKATV